MKWVPVIEVLIIVMIGAALFAADDGNYIKGIYYMMWAVLLRLTESRKG